MYYTKYWIMMINVTAVLLVNVCVIILFTPASPQTRELSVMMLHYDAHVGLS